MRGTSRVRLFFLGCGVWLLSSLTYAEEVGDKPEKSTTNQTKAKGFPWSLVIDRGKINGCVYKNGFYSEGSILIEETLPRKCKISAARDGFWSELNERELELFESSVKAQEELDKASVAIGDKPLDRFEAAVIKQIRRAKSNSK